MNYKVAKNTEKKNVETTKKVTTKKVEKEVSNMKPNLEKKSENNTCSKNYGHKMFFGAIMILQLILVIIGLVYIVNFDSKINSIEQKIGNVDSFFSENVQGYGSKNQAPSQTAGTQNQKIVDISADDDPFLGNPNAKVTVIEFSDLQCPFCRKFWTESYSQLKTDFIDTGKIKYVFRDFPLNFHPSAIPSGIAANCVREQLGNEAYFKFHDIAFSEQNKGGQGTIQFGETEILDWVSQVGGVDMAKFNICVKDPAQEAEIQNDFKDGSAAGVSGTPSFFINGKLIVGAQPYSKLKAEIEAALAK